MPTKLYFYESKYKESASKSLTNFWGRLQIKKPYISLTNLDLIRLQELKTYQREFYLRK